MKLSKTCVTYLVWDINVSLLTVEILMVHSALTSPGFVVAKVKLVSGEEVNCFTRETDLRIKIWLWPPNSLRNISILADVFWLLLSKSSLMAISSFKRIKV